MAVVVMGVVQVEAIWSPKRLNIQHPRNSNPNFGYTQITMAQQNITMICSSRAASNENEVHIRDSKAYCDSQMFCASPSMQLSFC